MARTYPYPSGESKVKWVSTEWLADNINAQASPPRDWPRSSANTEILTSLRSHRPAGGPMKVLDYSGSPHMYGGSTAPIIKPLPQRLTDAGAGTELAAKDSTTSRFWSRRAESSCRKMLYEEATQEYLIHPEDPL